MNTKAEETRERIMRLFLEGGIVPLDVHSYGLVDAQVRIILSRAMETPEEKKKRKWAGFQRAMAERQEMSR